MARSSPHKKLSLFKSSIVLLIDRTTRVLTTQWFWPLS